MKKREATKKPNNVNNFVAKHSQSKSGAGVHKTPKDYSRKGKRSTLGGED